MDRKFRIILGILLVFFTTRQIQCASLNNVRKIREAETTTATLINATSNIKQITNSSLSSSPSTKIDLFTEDAPSKESSVENKIKSKINDASSIENEHSKIQATTSDPNEKPIVSRGNKKYEQSKEEKETTTQVTDRKEEESTTSKSGRSLSIDIEKYISPEFHNKNNVYSMPTSPEIEKYLEPESHDYTNEATEEARKTSEVQTDFNSMELTTPHSNLFDPKFRMAVDQITQNLDEISSNTEQFKEDEEARSSKEDDKEKYEVSKLIDNYKNADNDTEISLHANEYKNIDLKTDKSKQNKGVESGKNVDYESKYFKTQEYGEKPENNNISDTSEVKSKAVDNDKHEARQLEVTAKTTIEAADTTQIKSQTASTTILPTKKPRTQISLRNNTIETTAPDSDIKPKSLKHFGDSSNIDPLREIEKATYTKPTYENAINISKRGSTKFTTTSEKSTATTVPSFMDYDNKNFSIPPTATAWTLVSLKEVPFSSTHSLKENQSIIEAEQNSQENHLVKIPLTTPGKQIGTTTEKPLEATKSLGNTIDYSTTTDSTDPTSADNTESESSKMIKKTTLPVTEPFTTTEEDQTTETEVTSGEIDNESITSTTREETTETDAATTVRDDTTKYDEDLLETLEDTTENTTSNIRTTTAVYEETTVYTTTEIPTTTENYSTTQQSAEEITTKLDSTETSEITTTDSTENITSTKDLPSTIVAYTETTLPMTTTTRKPTTSPLEEEDMDSGGEENDYPEVTLKKNTTDGNSPEIENVSIDNTPQSTETSTSSTLPPIIVIKATTTPSTFVKDSKSIFPNAENVTVDTTSSTESLSHDNDANDDSNAGMIAAITISSIGGVCLILLAGLLLIMRKRQKRVTYGQRCRPVSLDAYSLDNVSVYNSVRRKGALRASKRSYGNPAFDDPVSTSHQMNFQQLAKFVDNAEAMSAEFEEIPQVTARANEVPDGCETKNRYANVIPLPETRVFLKPFDNDPQSDYINANYVTGPKNIRGYYIATQGPMNSTVDDFWRMVWEQQCRVVLMLTNLYENGIEKCADYLPPSEVLDCHRLFGDFQITLKKREVKEKYIISSLQLKNMVSNSWREVTHLWYLGWPERGVPTEANSLIAFLIEARSHLKAASNNNSAANDYKSRETGNIHMSGSSGSSSESGPLVVHCSPGTGRTGTVIACDIAIRDFELTRNVDIPKIVYKVRRDRASAVQTKEQYSFIYKVISLYATKLTGGALESI